MLVGSEIVLSYIVLSYTVFANGLCTFSSFCSPSPVCKTLTYPLPRPHAADRPSTRLGEPSPVLGRVEGGGQPVLSCEQCFILFQAFPFLFAFDVGGLGFEFGVFVAGWRHGLRSEWPLVIGWRHGLRSEWPFISSCILILINPLLTRHLCVVWLITSSSDS